MSNVFDQFRPSRIPRLTFYIENSIIKSNVIETRACLSTFSHSHGRSQVDHCYNFLVIKLKNQIPASEMSQTVRAISTSKRTRLRERRLSQRNVDICKYPILMPLKPSTTRISNEYGNIPYSLLSDATLS